MPKRLRKTVGSIRHALDNATARYAGGVVLLLALGVLGLFWADRLHAGHPWIELLQGLGEAFIVSGFLALLVDPYLKKRLEDDSSWSTLFGYLNPKAPPDLRQAIQELAACKRYYPSVKCSANFAWADEAKTILAVTLEMFETGISLDPEPYRPASSPWVLASTDGWTSKYLRYSLSCPSHIVPLDLSGAKLERFLSRESDGSIALDQEKAVDGRVIPPNVHFERRYRVRMYRHASGYVPFQHNDFIEKLTVAVSGPALPDIDIRVMHPRQVGTGKPIDWKHPSTDPANPDTHECGRATPGNTTLVSWYPVRNAEL